MSATVGKMRIGEVHALLRQDYPEIELSKIRYYEDKGLVEPTRSRKGYRLYSDRDVACLREAIRLAQEEFVPLRVVRLRLIEQGLLNEAPSTSTARHVARDATNAISVVAPSTSSPVLRVVPSTSPTGEDTTTASGQPLRSNEFLTTQEFIQTTRLDVGVINQLTALGFVTPTAVAGETVFTDIDVRVALCAGALLGRGVDARLLGPLRRIVEREIGVIEDLTEPLRLPGVTASESRASHVAESVASEVAALRAVLMERALHTYLER